MQMLVAAINPSATTGTNISALLFSDNVRGRGPSPVFGTGTPCVDAVQGQENSFRSLLLDYGMCLDRGRSYNSMTFPSLCGESTSAVPGLREIYNTASTTLARHSSAAVLMLTDGVIQDNATDRTSILNRLRSAGIDTLIAAGIGGADVENLKLYTTSADNVLVGSDPVELGIDIVNHMASRSILCQDHGKLKLRSYDMCCKVHDIFIYVTNLCEFIKTGLLIKFMQFLFICSSCLCIVTYNKIKIYAVDL